METMKKKWGKPLTGVQEFAPQEFIAACQQDPTMVTYDFWCDAGVGNQYKVYLDSNNNGRFDLSSDRQLTDRWHVFEPCNETHSVTVPKGQSIDNVFPKGFMVLYDSWGLHTDDVTAVRIWRGENNNNIHCTTQLHESEFQSHNPS